MERIEARVRIFHVTHDACVYLHARTRMSDTVAWAYKGDSRARSPLSSLPFSLASVISEHREKRDAGCDVTAALHICVHTATRAIALRRNNSVSDQRGLCDPPRRLVFEPFLEFPLRYLCISVFAIVARAYICVLHTRERNLRLGEVRNSGGR